MESWLIFCLSNGLLSPDSALFDINCPYSKIHFHQAKTRGTISRYSQNFGSSSFLFCLLPFTRFAFVILKPKTMDIQIENIQTRLGISGLNELQQRAIEAHQQFQEIVLLSVTGSGKTLAFLLPVAQYIQEEKNTTQALIISPTRELALQIERVFKSMQTGISVTCCYGGHKREIEENNLSENPSLIIGTPGRLCDHIRRGNILTESIGFLVLDEFDKSLELGFIEEVDFIKSSLPALERCTLASATDSPEINQFLVSENPFRIDFLDRKRENKNAFTLQYLRSESEDKMPELTRLLCFHGGRNSVIFCNFREDVERCSQKLSEAGIQNVFYHGAMEQRDRETALYKFENGSSRYLVTTDLAARGLDFEHIRYVIHYQLPMNEKSFTHRNGRTARMDKSGTAILLLSPKEYLPDYLDGQQPDPIELPKENYPLPDRPEWVTLYIAAGKKNKVNKIDIVGFLAKQGDLKMEDIGRIEVKDFNAFAAVRRTKATHALHQIQNQKLKNKKVKIDVAK